MGINQKVQLELNNITCQFSVSDQHNVICSAVVLISIQTSLSTHEEVAQ
jgi:hypothetical protein